MIFLHEKTGGASPSPTVFLKTGISLTNRPAVKLHASLRDGSKEPSGTKAEKSALLRADMEFSPAEQGETAGGASPSPTLI